MKKILSNKNTITMLCIILIIVVSLIHMFTYKGYCESHGGTYVNINGKVGCIYGNKHR